MASLFEFVIQECGSDGHFVGVEFAHNSNRLVDKDIATLPHSLLYRKIL